MKLTNQKKAMGSLIWVFLWIPVTAVQAQEVDDDEIIELNPFVVESEDSEGYRATATLAGTRVRTDLRDISSSVSVVTEQFLEDTASTNQEDLLVYTPSTEVAGLKGNAALVGNNQGATDNDRLVAPSTSTRVRGLAAADNTRDYFLTDIPWDSYNVDRVVVSRGPNSILFGIGSPAGIINTATKTASFENSGEYANMVDGDGRFRNSLNINREIIEDKFAIRIAGLHDDEEFQQEPAYELDKRIFLAIRAQDKVFGDKHGALTLRANYEVGDIESNRPRILPPYDNITPWFDPSHLNKRLFEGRYAGNHSQLISIGNPLDYPDNAVPYLSGSIQRFNGANPTFFVDGVTGETTMIRAAEVHPSPSYGIDENGDIDSSIQGIPFSRMVSVAGMNTYSQNVSALAGQLGQPDPFPSALKGFYKDQVIFDPEIFDFYNHLIDGPNKREFNEWDAYNVALSQTFWNDRLGIELVYDYQKMDRGREGLFVGAPPSLNVDINEYLLVGEDPTVEYDWNPPAGEGPPPDYASASGGTKNPNAGRAFISGNSRFGNNAETIERENYRATLFGELRASDVFEKDSFLEKVLGLHRFTGLWSEDTRKRNRRDYGLFGTDVEWATSQGFSPALNGLERKLSWAIYLSDPLFDVSDATQGNIQRVKNYFNPHGEFNVGYFDTHWKHPLDPTDPAYVDPSQPYVRGIDGEESTQSENPDHYVGFTSRPVNIFNAREGDIGKLYQNGSKNVDIITSKGFTWQGFLWDGAIVPTVGWREDEIETYGGGAPTIDPDTLIVDPFFNLSQTAENTTIQKDETVSWGVVGHITEILPFELPRQTEVSLIYNKGENFTPVTRYGYDAKPLPSPSGETTEYGFSLSTLEDRLNLKVIWYETEVKNDNLSGALGANGYFLFLMEGWVTAGAKTHTAYMAGIRPDVAWFSNWAAYDDPSIPMWTSQEEIDALYANNEVMIRQKNAVAAWFDTMPSQEWFDAFGFNVDVEAAQSGDPGRIYNEVLPGATFPWEVQPAGGGKVNGFDPQGTVDFISEGVEVELSYRITRNWDLTLNVTKTDASRGDLGANLVEWLEHNKERYDGPAGDMTLWGAVDQNVRGYFYNNVYSAYQFQLAAKGQQAPEIRPWRVNVVTNYKFTDGPLEGFNIGGSMRWEDDLILGYRLNDAQDNLDVNRPIHGGSETSYDLWIGYQRALTDKVDWRIQLNVRNLGGDDELIPVSVNPDGRIAAARISQGQSFTITNTLKF